MEDWGYAEVPFPGLVEHLLCTGSAFLQYSMTQIPLPKHVFKKTPLLYEHTIQWDAEVFFFFLLFLFLYWVRCSVPEGRISF